VRNHPVFYEKSQVSHWICENLRKAFAFLVISHEILTRIFLRLRLGGGWLGGGWIPAWNICAAARVCPTAGGAKVCQTPPEPAGGTLPCWTALHRARRSPSLPSGLRASEHRPAYAAVGGEPERRFDQPQHRDETVFPDDDIRSSLGRKGPETDRSDHLVQCMARFPPLCRRTHPWSANRSGWTRPRFGRLPSAAEQQISLRCLKSSDQRRAQSCQHADG
jgi:hypothetical protein